MGYYYENVIRPILFRMDPEKAHDLGVTVMDYLGRISPLCRLMERVNLVRSESPVEAFGIQFPNAVGLAAGMDKNGRFWRAASALGFGHIEIGTITFQEQPGNDRPRVFRYPESRAIVNRMGFNNEGAEAVAARLKKTLGGKKARVPLGINIGKSKVVPLDQAVEDYLSSFQSLAEYADYMTLNVSSPNTRDLRKLQEKDHLESLLEVLCEANRHRARKLGVKPTPLLIKIAPDLSFREIDRILEVIDHCQLDGIVATNTTTSRPRDAISAKETGGLSGRPLHPLSLSVVNYISRATGGKLPIIGVGGITSPETAGAMVDNGAWLVQVYTGMVYGGPFVASSLAKALAPRQSSWV
ncbi:MAG: quinone-dependent dihydroorotate dehydrogenase [Oceanipulchritudo sp.]